MLEVMQLYTVARHDTVTLEYAINDKTELSRAVVIKPLTAVGGVTVK